MKISVFDRVENAFGKDAAVHHHLLFSVSFLVKEAFENIVGKEKMLLTTIFS